jgi:hypothetical protein
MKEVIHNMTHFLPTRVLVLGLMAATLLVIQGCASHRPAGPASAASPATAASGGGASPAVGGQGVAPLVGEARWLRELFNGTPVGIADEAYGVVRLTVPLVHGFEPASSTPKPALKAVLDRVGQSLQRRNGAWVQLAAPGPQAAQRQQAMKSHLLALKVASWRVTGMPGATPADTVVLRLLPGDGPLPRP